MEAISGFQLKQQAQLGCGAMGNLYYASDPGQQASGHTLWFFLPINPLASATQFAQLTLG